MVSANSKLFGKDTSHHAQRRKGRGTAIYFDQFPNPNTPVCRWWWSSQRILHDLQTIFAGNWLGLNPLEHGGEDLCKDIVFGLPTLIGEQGWHGLHTGHKGKGALHGEAVALLVPTWHDVNLFKNS